MKKPRRGASSVLGSDWGGQSHRAEFTGGGPIISNCIFLRPRETYNSSLDPSTGPALYVFSLKPGHQQHCNA